ncbi:MAG: hypothetical protein J5888_03180, partial [Bacteroidaceae bacterium]|nr:hypothetical protein [Bacteroidaceae bacterium]
IPLGSWEAEVECDRQFFLAHLAFLDTQLQPYIPTDITSLKENSTKEEPRNAYTLLGQPIDPRQLKKGIYIINGKKVTIR